MKINLLFSLILLAFFTQSCAEGNTQVVEKIDSINQKVDSLFLAGIPQGNVANHLLEEVSGLVASQRYPNRLYVQTDSGGEAAVFVLDRLGNELGRLDLSGLKNFAEPELLQAIPSTAIDKVTLQFPGGPKDAETLLADPISGTLFLVSKREPKNAVYQVPATAFEKGSATLEKVHEFDFNSSVAGDISKDGSQILIKTYLAVFYWKRTDKQSLVEALKVAPMRLPYVPEPQGEAIGFNFKGDAYFTLSEKRNGVTPTLYRYPKK